MILKIRHKGLKAYWEKQDTKSLNQDWIERIHRIMHALELARAPEDMNFPGWRLHALKGSYQGYYAVNVSGNWRIIFRFQGADTTDIDLVDYH